MKSTNGQKKTKTSYFEFCKEKNKSITEELSCKQDAAHKSMVENPLGFIVFYIVIVIFLGLLFQLTQKKFNNKKEKK